MLEIQGSDVIKPAQKASVVFIPDPKLLEDMLKDPAASIGTKIFWAGFYCRRQHGTHFLNISWEALEELAKSRGAKSPTEAEEVEIRGTTFLVIPKFSKTITTISTGCKVEDKFQTSDVKNGVDATISLISRRKLDTAEVVLISDGDTALTKKLTELGTNVNILSSSAALDKIDHLFEQPSNTRTF